MNIVRPSWYLNQVCSRCGQGDALGYRRCLECGSFVLCCDEELIEFVSLDPHNLVVRRGRSGTCSVCAGSDTLRDVSSDEMIELGFTRDDYH